METLYWSAKDVATTTLADSQGLRRDSDQVTELNKGWFVPPTNLNPGNKYHVKQSEDNPKPNNSINPTSNVEIDSDET